MISGNGRRGIIVMNRGSARIGINNSSSAYVPTEVSGNGTDGILVHTGASAFIGGTTAQNNGTDTSAAFRFGISVSRASATLIGDNTIGGHPNSGVFVSTGGAVRIGDSGFGLPSGNTISNNGLAATPSGTLGGIFALQGSSVEVRGATITSNVGAGVFAFENAVLDISDGTVIENRFPTPRALSPPAAMASPPV